jgi:predicted transcriptional regulator of viral defense system
MFISTHIDALQAAGRYSLTKGDLQNAFPGKSPATLNVDLWRLSESARLSRIYKGFYAIIPLEYRSKGLLPAEWFIDDLMAYLERPYYVGLLSAAALHGAAHQQPQIFQVVVRNTARAIERGDLRIHFYRKRTMESSATIISKTPTGTMRVSDPAVTACDLVAFAPSAGGLSNVSTVLSDLRHLLTPEMLVAALAGFDVSVVQRLGWLLHQTGEDEIVWRLSHWLMERRPREVPLDPAMPTKGCSRDPRWRVVVNTIIEPDA